MKTNSSILIGLVVLLGAGCVTSELEGDCLEYKNIPIVVTECTRPTSYGQRYCVSYGQRYCVDQLTSKPFCVRSTGNADK
jgi:hypothetical protein